MAATDPNTQAEINPILPEAHTELKQEELPQQQSQKEGVKESKKEPTFIDLKALLDQSPSFKALVFPDSIDVSTGKSNVVKNLATSSLDKIADHLDVVALDLTARQGALLEREGKGDYGSLLRTLRAKGIDIQYLGGEDGQNPIDTFKTKLATLGNIFAKGDVKIAVFAPDPDLLTTQGPFSIKNVLAHSFGGENVFVVDASDQEEVEADIYDLDKAA